MYLADTNPKQLYKIAACHSACFPNSLSTKLGFNYVVKSMEWFLVNPNRFLFHVQEGDNIIGYCGGFVPRFYGDGSSSGMLQHAFSNAVAGIIRKPWLILNEEVRPHYRFLWLNIKRKLSGKSIPLDSKNSEPKIPQHVGLVVIGVHPDYRGSGVAKLLMEEFENKAKSYHKQELILSVKTNNHRAINAYKKFGWNILTEQKHTYIMNKLIS